MRYRVAAVSAAVGVALTGALALASANVAVAKAAHPNMVIEWNQTMITAFTTASVAPPVATRQGGIFQSAVFDAVNGIDPKYTAIHVQPAAPDGASGQAAAASAAYTILLALYPSQKTSLLDGALASSIASMQDEEDARSIAAGLSWGQTVAQQTLAWRATDGFSAPPPSWSLDTTPGIWQPTPGPACCGAPRFQTLATTTPFALASPSQFRPAGPPALTSARYAADYTEVKVLGSLTSTVRTPWQTETARFWQGDNPTAMWDRVADSLASDHHFNLLRSARLLALVNDSIADAAMAVWDAKVTFNSWRPVTAIANAGTDGNPDTAPEAGWLPLMATPYFQEYVSAHSGVSGAATSILAATFGNENAFTLTAAALPGVQRSFTSFSDSIAQVADARVWAGFHFRFACDDGAVLGNQVAGYVSTHLMQKVKDDGGESD